MNLKRLSPLMVSAACIAGCDQDESPEVASKSWEQSVGDARQQPVTLEPVGPEDDVLPRETGLWRYRINVDPGGDPANVWATVRNTTNGYVMGNARDDVTFDVTWRSSNFVYYYGHAYGNYDGCGVIYARNVDSKDGTPADMCGTDPNYDLRNFAQYVNSTPVGDGRETMVQACPDNRAWANVRPWSDSSSPTDEVRRYDPGRVVLWRYVTRSSPAFVLIRDPTLGPNEGQGNWVFIARDCLPTPLPDEEYLP